jgi:hypothetical protein
MRYKVLFFVVALAAVGFLAGGASSSPGATARIAPDGPGAYGGAPADSATAAARNPDAALVILSTLDMESLREIMNVVRDSGGEILQAYPPNALVVVLSRGAEASLRRHPALARIERDVADPAALKSLSGQAETAARIWNTVFRGVPDLIGGVLAPEPPPQWKGPDALVAPAQAALEGTVPGAPSATQASEFMAGTVVYSVVFVESSGGSGECSPADTQTENWDAPRRATVLTEISDGLAFWTGRSNRPSPLTFVLDNLGTQPTSCEPINRRGGPADAPSYGEEGLWMADVLRALGRSGATPNNYLDEAQAFAASRRAYYGSDWAYVMFVVDSLNDADGRFADGGYSAYAYLNGPLMVMTYDNDGWFISRMNLVALHETGHVFGALDEYALSGCSTADTWGYLNVANSSCNNGGDTTDISVMGEGSELNNPAADVSTSARGAIGWRNPVEGVVDVVKTATVSLTPYTPDPSSDNTPTCSASAGNSPFPPGGCNTVGGICYRTPSPVTISKVAGAQWNLDSSAFTSGGVVATDGAFDEEAEAYAFTPQSGVSNGPHTFGTKSVNNFGHWSSVAADSLAISAPVGGIQELPDRAESALETAESSRGSSPPYAAIAGAGAAALFAITASAWYARRRWGAG